jgi:hypothetical protein
MTRAELRALLAENERGEGLWSRRVERTRTLLAAMPALLDRIEVLEAALSQAEKQFAAFDDAIERAQRMYHNCQDWTDEERDPIQFKRESFYRTTRAALGKGGG